MANIDIHRLETLLCFMKFVEVLRHVNFNTFLECVKLYSCLAYLYFSIPVSCLYCEGTLLFITGRPLKRKLEDGNENVEKRQKKINATYSQLLDLAQVSGRLYCMVENLNCVYIVCYL